MKKKIKDVEFAATLMNIKLTSGEEILGVIAIPSSKTFDYMDNVMVDAAHNHNVFYPAKIKYFIDPSDSLEKVHLVKWSPVATTKHISINKVNVISISSATTQAQKMYEHWVRVTYNTDHVTGVQEAIREHYGLVDVKSASDQKAKKSNIYPTHIFKNIPDSEKKILYSAILASADIPTLN